ncbi:MAG: hypothetical protein KAV87_07975 [Desulfobacteraceae bacterium]|nr:hypothetical protein [Desulfobacteraceae bacterium]
MCGTKGMKISPRQGTARGRAWQSMRIFLTFGLAEIEATAEISNHDLRKYLKLLMRYGYVILYRRSHLVKKRRWRLIKNTGLKPPIMRYRTGLYDPNTKEEFREGENELA